MKNYTKESIKRLVEAIEQSGKYAESMRKVNERQNKEFEEELDRIKREGGVIVSHLDFCRGDFHSATIRKEYTKDGRIETHHEETVLDKTHTRIKSYSLKFDKDDNLTERCELGTKVLSHEPH